MVARNLARFFKHESCGQCTPCREGSGWLYQLMNKIEAGDGKTKDLDLALEIATSMGSMPGTTICGLADGNNWAIRTIMNKFRPEFEARVTPTFIPVRMTIGASSRCGRIVMPNCVHSLIARRNVLAVGRRRQSGGASRAVRYRAPFSSAPLPALTDVGRERIQG